MPYLAVILFLPWFLLLGSLYWLFPRQPRNARDLQVVDARHHASLVGPDLETQGAEPGPLVLERPGALGLDDGAHLLERAARIEDVARDRETVAAADVGVAFEQPAGQAQRLLAQVLRRQRVVLEHAHDIARFQHIQLAFIQLHHKRIIILTHFSISRSATCPQQIQHPLRGCHTIANARFVIEAACQLLHAKNGRLGKY